MTKLENQTVAADVLKDNFNEIIGDAVTSCIGVAGMSNKWQLPRVNICAKKQPTTRNGVRVYRDGRGLMVVDLHVLVNNGLNISATVRSIHTKVRYTVEQATGQQVKNVNVFVEGMLTSGC